MDKKQLASDKAKSRKEAGQPEGNYVVLQEFHDIVDFSKVHKVGDSANKFDPERLDELIEMNLVGEKPEEEK